MAGNMAVAYALKKRAKKAGCGCNGAGCEMCKGGKMMAEGGEAKEGPKEVGKTQSGKSIYPHHKDPRHKDFTKQDHLDAMEHHVNAQGPLNAELHQIGRKHPTSESGFGTNLKTLASQRDHHKRMAGAHSDASDDAPEMAEGGEVGDDDMVNRIMSKRYAHGGDVKKDDDELADFSPNEFDETELEPAPEGEYPGSQEHGDEEEDERRRDIVSRIMRSRAKRDKMPRPA